MTNVTLQEGRYYVTRDGQKVGPAPKAGYCGFFYVRGKFTSQFGEREGYQVYRSDGSVLNQHPDEDGDTIVSEWIEPSTPVRRVTTTRTEIVPGTYDRLAVEYYPPSAPDVVRVYIGGVWSSGGWAALNADECRALARTIDQLGDALDAIKAERGGK